MNDQHPHILGDYDTALKNSKRDVLTMASIASENLRNSVRGLIERDEDLCNDAIAEDEEINAFERSIDRDGMDILTRFTPVATDLRMVISAMKISANLERIGDQAENIARRARKILKNPEVPEASMIEPVYTLAAELLEDSVRAFSEGDTTLALGLYDRDLKLDKLHRKTMKVLTKAMESDTDNLKTYLNLIFVVRCLERVGDHAVNIGEDAIYVEEAADIRHIGPSALDGEEE